MKTKIWFKHCFQQFYFQCSSWNSCRSPGKLGWWLCMYTSPAFVPHSHLPTSPPFPAGSLSLTWAWAAYRKPPAWVLATSGSNSAEGPARVHHDKGTWISWDLSLLQGSTSWMIREYGSTANLLLRRLQDQPNSSPAERVSTGYVAWVVLWVPLHPQYKDTSVTSAQHDDQCTVLLSSYRGPVFSFGEARQADSWVG